MNAAEYIRERTLRWAEQTQETYRCPCHQEPNPFCDCVDATGQKINGQITYDGKWEERAAAIQSSRRRYHVWADQQRSEVQARRQQFKQMIESKQVEKQRFKKEQLQREAAGFVVIGQQRKGRK